MSRARIAAFVSSSASGLIQFRNLFRLEAMTLRTVEGAAADRIVRFFITPADMNIKFVSRQTDRALIEESMLARREQVTAL